MITSLELIHSYVNLYNYVDVCDHCDCSMFILISVLLCLSRIHSTNKLSSSSYRFTSRSRNTPTTRYTFMSVHVHVHVHVL